MLGDHIRSFICRRCLKSYTSKNMLTLHKPNCGNNDLATVRTSSDPHLHWENNFHKNSLYFSIYAEFEADNENDNSSTGNKTTNIYKHTPLPNDYHLISELDGVLKNGYYRSSVGYNNVDWFVNEVIKLENKMAFYLKNSTK